MIEITNITKTYNPKRSNEFTALKDISLTVKDGETAAKIGKSGAGKSTLIHILACIDNYQEGEYKIDGILVKERSEKQTAQIRRYGGIRQEAGKQTFRRTKKACCYCPWCK